MQFWGPKWPRNDKHSNVYHLGVILVPKMPSLRSGTQHVRFKFGSDELKFGQLQLPLQVEVELELEFDRELELEVNFSFGVGGRGRSPCECVTLNSMLRALQ